LHDCCGGRASDHRELRGTWQGGPIEWNGLHCVTNALHVRANHAKMLGRSRFARPTVQDCSSVSSDDAQAASRRREFSVASLRRLRIRAGWDALFWTDNVEYRTELGRENFDLESNARTIECWGGRTEIRSCIAYRGYVSQLTYCHLDPHATPGLSRILRFLEPSPFERLHLP
jgi:hypothetical protein